MDSKQHTHPSLVLINDEILSTQVRLMELYVKQAEAMASNEAARTQERFQTELTTLQEKLKKKEIALETQQTLSHQADQDLRAEVQELRARLLATQCSLQVRQTELDFARSDAHVLQQRVAQSESTVQKAYASIEIEVARARETWQEELSALEEQLQRKESALQQLQASTKELEGNLRAENQDLRSQLDSKLELLKNRTDELQNAQRETALLRQHMQQFALTGAKTEAAASEAIRIRETLQAELTSLQTAYEQKNLSLQQNEAATEELEERFTAQLHDLQNQLGEKQALLEAHSQEVGELTARTSDLQEQITCLELANKQTVKEAKAAAQAIEDTLRARIQELETIVSEKARQWQNSAAELESAQIETALLHQRIQQLVLNREQTEAAAREAIRIRETLEAELISLRAAFEQKDVLLQQNQAARRALEDRLTAQLHDLQKQLVEKQGLLEARGQEIGELTAKTSDLQEQITCLELAHKQTVKEAKAAARAVEDSLRARIQELEATVSEKAQGLQNRTVELESAQSETALLRQRIQQLEQTGAQTEEVKNEADRRREALQNELGNVHRALQQKEALLAQREVEFRESSEDLRTQLLNLQNQLTEKQQQLDSKDVALGHAAGQIAGLTERITQVESIHAEAQAGAAADFERLRFKSQAEIAELQRTLREREQALEEGQTAIAQFEANLNDQIRELQNQLTQKQERLERRDQEFDSISSEMAALRKRLTELESSASEAKKFAGEAERIRCELQTNIAALQAQLKEKEFELAEGQALIQESEGRLRTQIHDQQIQITEKQLLLEARNVEIADLQNNLTTASEQLARLEAGQHEVATAASNADLARQRFEAELAARQEELQNLQRQLTDHEAQSYDLRQTFNTQLHDLQNQLAEKQGLLEARSQEIGELTARTSDLQEQITCLELANKQTVKEAKASARAVEDSLRARIQELEATVSEKAQGLQNRTVELESVQSETALLRQRIQQLEQTGAQTEEVKNEADRRREALQNELGNVHRALQQKEALLAQREVEFRESSEDLRTQLLNLQNQLTEKQQQFDSKDVALGHAAGQIAGLTERITQVESIHAEAQAGAAADVERLRLKSQAEIAELQRALRDREQALEQGQTAIAQFEANLNDQIRDLQNQLTQKQERLESRDQEFDSISSEMAALRERLTELESSASEAKKFAGEAERIRCELQTNIAALQAQLKEKEFELAEGQALIQESEGRLRTQIHDQQIQITEKQLLLEARNVEIADLQNNLTTASEQLARLEAGQHEVATAASNADVARQRFEAELAARQEELRNLQGLLADHEAQSYALRQTFDTQVHDLQKQLVEKQGLLEARGQEIGELTAKTSDLQEQITCLELANKQTVKEAKAAARAVEDSLRARLQELEATVSEKAQGLQSRTVELESVQAETAPLRERIQQLEQTGAQTEEVKNEADRRREALQNELGNVHRALQQKEALLAQREVDFRESSEDLRTQL